MAYSPGLKIKELALVRKTRRLPIKGRVLVKEGDAVSFDTIVAKTEIPGEPHIVNVAMQIGIDPTIGDDINEYMLKKIGDYVEKGEAIAMTSMFFGLFKEFSKSPATGVLERVSKISGQAVIREDPVPVSVRAYIPGNVREILPSEGAVIETPAAFIQGVFGIGGETHGEIVIAESSDRPLTADEVYPEYAGKILVVRTSPEIDALRKAVEVGAKGIVAGGIDGEDLTDFMGYEIGVAITGFEEVGLTIIITEGFGRMKMAEKTFELLKRFEGKKASINGATQIRAGVIRPETIIPLEEVDLRGLTGYDVEDTKALSRGLMPGTPIRIIREPYFGALGHVVSLPPSLRVVETESQVRILEAELEDHRRVIVPRANVEIIGE